ncbi:MAG: N-acetylmuramoyl-L-alanine amidase [Sphingomonas sp.]
MTDMLLMEPDRPSRNEAGVNSKWYPLAEVMTPHMPTRGDYPDGYPRGAIVHFTAGRDRTEDNARNTIAYGREQGYCFFAIGPTGIVYQAFPLNRWGYHAGESAWPGLGSGVSSKLVGIEVLSAGLLDKNRKSWFGEQYAANEVRSVTEAQHGCPTGIYRRFTDAQERALKSLLLWLRANNPAVFSLDLVLGHHEVSGKKGIGRWRKNDPGGALSMPMEDFRKALKAASPI